MTRRVAKILTVLSVLPCLAGVALWVRSYWRSDAFGFQQRCSEQDPRSDYSLYSTRGRLTLCTAMIGLSATVRVRRGKVAGRARGCSSREPRRCRVRVGGEGRQTMADDHPMAKYAGVLKDLAEGRTEPDDWVAWWNEHAAELESASCPPGWLLGLKPKGFQSGNRFDPVLAS